MQHRLISFLTEETSTKSAIIEDLLPLASLTTDQDREDRAAQSSPGEHTAIVGQDTFQHVPEYNDHLRGKAQLLSPPNEESASVSEVREVAVPPHPSTVVLRRFKDVPHKTLGSEYHPALQHLPGPMHTIIEDGNFESNPDKAIILEEQALMTENARTRPIERTLKQFGYEVWQRIVPVDLYHTLKDASTTFPPVSAAEEIPTVAHSFYSYPTR